MIHVLEARRLSPNALPLIDIEGLWSSRPLMREAVGRRIREACLDKGFFYATNHGVTPELVRGVFAEARRFFRQPLEVKRRVDKSLSACERGYLAYREHVLEAGVPPDLREGFSIGLEVPADDPRALAGRFNHGPNQWPEALPSFRPVMTTYLAAMQEIGTRLMRGIALSLGLPERYFDAFCREPMMTLRLFHYPPQPANAPPGEKGAGAHTDWDALTILLQDDIGGLQIYDRNVGWVHVDPVEGALTVNIGDMLARWTNDLYRSTVHRVVNASSGERYSVPFFLGGNPDQIIEALPGCFGPDLPPYYPATTAEGHMREMSGQGALG